MFPFLVREAFLGTLSDKLFYLLVIKFVLLVFHRRFWFLLSSVLFVLDAYLELAR